MKFLTAIAFLLSTFVVQENVEAQTRGPRYNPNPGSSRPAPSSGPSTSRPSPSRERPSPTTSTPPRGPSYNPGRTTPSQPSTTYNPPRTQPSTTGGYTGTPTTPRGPRYNPNPGRGNPTPSTPSTGTYNPPRPQPSTTGGYTGTPTTPRGPRYNPNPGTGTPGRGPVITRPTPGTTPRGPRYNPNPGRGPVVTRPGTTTPRYYPRPTTPSYRIPGYNRGPNYGRSYNPHQRPIRTHYGTRYYHRPFGYSPVRYSHYYHAPYRTTYYHSVRYYRSYDWYNFVWRSSPNYIYAHWIFYPATGYNNGYWTIDNYPYYVYNGYRYRYSTNDYCNYQLVDKYDHRVVQTYWNQVCNTGYDACSFERDRLNSQMNDYRYFCSETYRDYGYDYSQPSYDDVNYPQTTDTTGGYDDNTCSDANRDGMCDDYTGTSSTCSDNDGDGYCDPGTYSEMDEMSEYSEAI